MTTLLRRSVVVVCSLKFFNAITAMALLTLAVSAVGTVGMQAQVTFDPGRLFLDAEHRSQNLVITNTTSTAKDVLVTPRFGIPTTDSLGRMLMHYSDAANSSELDARPYITVFPRRFILPPGGKQSVLFSSVPPTDLTDGMYCMRVAVKSRDVLDSAPYSSDTSTTNLTTCAEDIPLWFVHGAADVSLTPRRFSVAMGPDGRRRLLVETGPDGNAPFLGSVGVVVMQNAQILFSHPVMVNLYRTEQTLLLPVGHRFAPGEYEMQLYWTLGRKNTIPVYSESYSTVVDRFTFVVEPDGAMAIR